MHVDTQFRCDRCGGLVAREEALEALFDEIVYYFCSTRCREEKGYVPEREEAPEEEQATLEGS